MPVLASFAARPHREPALTAVPPIVPGCLEFDSGGVPRSPLYGDVFHAADGGGPQARHVFLSGNGLPEGWRDRAVFTILETGFGLGVNFLETWRAAAADPRRPARLHYVAIEKHPLAAGDLERALAACPAFGDDREALVAQWPLPLGGAHRLLFRGGAVTLALFFGDVADLATRIDARFDALFLDGFAPGRNPQMWSAPVLRALAQLAAPEATVATWSVAGEVRAALAAAGFEVEKLPGFGGKRERLVGRYAPRWPQAVAAPEIAPHAGERDALVLGAGLAGASIASRLVRRGWRVQVLEARPGPACGASGNPAGAFQPLLSHDDNVASRLTRAAMLVGMREWGEALRSAPGALSPCGVLRVARDPVHEAKQARAIAARALPGGWARFVDRDEASDIAGARVALGGWWFPQAGWLSPPALCAAWLAEGASVRYDAAVAAIAREGADWLALGADGKALGRAPVLIVATGAGLPLPGPAAALRLRRVRGQLTELPAGSLPPIRCVVAREGYVTPALPAGLHVLGATYDFGDDSEIPTVDGHRRNLERLGLLLPEASPPMSPGSLGGRAAVRSVARDRLPVVGPLPDAGAYCLLGFASRGIVWSALAGEILACALEGEPMPVERDLVRAIGPARVAADPTLLPRNTPR